MHKEGARGEKERLWEWAGLHKEVGREERERAHGEIGACVCRAPTRTCAFLYAFLFVRVRFPVRVSRACSRESLRLRCLGCCARARSQPCPPQPHVASVPS